MLYINDVQHFRLHFYDPSPILPLMMTEKKRGKGRPTMAPSGQPRIRKMYRMTPEIVKALQKAKRRTKLSETAYVELALKEKLIADGIIKEPESTTHD
jgi:hypothetical protein